MTYTTLLFALVPVAISLAIVSWLIAPVRMSRDPSREGFQDEEASHAYDRTSTWPVFALERYLIVRSLRRKTPSGLLVDVGCGPGFLAASIVKHFPGVQAVGVDINRYMVSIAKTNRSRFATDYGLVLADVSALPMASGSANVVVTSLSVHHWTDPHRAFAEIYRVLAPGGRLLVFDARRNVPRAVFLAFHIGQRLFSPQAIRRTNGAVGSLQASYTGPELKGLMLAQPLQEVRVSSMPGWILAEGTKPPEVSG